MEDCTKGENDKSCGSVLLLGTDLNIHSAGKSCDNHTQTLKK